MEGSIQTMTFAESVRKRPAMYFGNNGIIGLFTGLILDCIELCQTDQIFFSVSILEVNKFSFAMASEKDITPFLQCLNPAATVDKNFFLKALVSVSSNFEIIHNSISQIHGKAETLLIFEFDQAVFKDTKVDYQELSEEFLRISLLNRSTEILVKDARQKYFSQNYYHFPQGIFYLYDRIKMTALGKPVFEIAFDYKWKENKYQIAIGYRTDWYPSASIVSFSNDIHTIGGGTLVAGVLDGLILACKKYVTDNNLTTFKIKRKKFVNGLIMVCAVRGENFKYAGSFKETLIDKDVKAQAKKIVSKQVYEYIKNNKESADKFLWRFDEKQLTSGMY